MSEPEGLGYPSDMAIMGELYDYFYGHLAVSKIPHPDTMNARVAQFMISLRQEGAPQTSRKLLIMSGIAWRAANDDVAKEMKIAEAESSA
jgi:hypothetical protein